MASKTLIRAPRSASLGEQFLEDADAIQRQAMTALFGHLEAVCEGAVAVDSQARIVWMSDKYRQLLGLRPETAVLGREVEEIIPNSLMRQVVESGRPALLDVMEVNSRWLVVTRIPLRDDGGRLIGALGFVLYEHLDYVKPLVSKVTQLQKRLAAAQRELSRSRRAKYTLSSFVGTSAAARTVKQQARRAAQLDSTVLLLGETGVGKELLAHAIHAASPRADGPFVGVNLAAIPDTLLEAEFFGVAPGAYTGADRRGREGKFKLADGGTLFLDEVGDMPLPVQAKLLRALQEREIETLGSNRVDQVDVRVVAATSLDLERLVVEGRFRADLYYRLNVLPITVPPLRERLADLDVLCESLLEKITLDAGLPQREVTPDGLDLLAGYRWPGNIRELRNILERACALKDNTRLAAPDLEDLLPAGAPPLAGHRPLQAPRVRPLAKAVAEAERGTILEALEACGGCRAEAARQLGISRANLYAKMGRLGIGSNRQR